MIPVKLSAMFDKVVGQSNEKICRIIPQISITHVIFIFGMVTQGIGVGA